MTRATLRPQPRAISRHSLAATMQTRQYAAGPGPEPTTTGPADPKKQPPGVGDQGKAKDFNKDGTDPNKNVVYAALGSLGLGGVLYFSMSSPKPKDLQNSPAASAR